MVFSIRELIILTVYCSLLLTNIEWILVSLLFAANASSLFIVILFGMASFKLLFAREASKNDKKFLVPLALLFVCILSPTVAIAPIRISNLPLVITLNAAMYIGLVSGSIPLLAMLDSRFPVVNGKLLWVGYWSLLFAAMGGAIVPFVASLDMELLRIASNANPVRIAAFGGLFGAVAVSWLLSPRKHSSIYGEEYDEP